MSNAGGMSMEVGAKMLGALGRLPGELQTAKKNGLRVAGEHVLGVSNDRVPHESGDLERSGAVSQDDDGTTAVSYDTDYAVKQHEDLQVHHDQGRQAKYLESALYETRDEVAAIVTQAIKKGMGL